MLIFPKPDFKQEMAPAVDFEGKVLLETKSKISTSPNGNGGWFVSLDRNGLVDKIHEMGIEWLNIFAVDNVLQKIADPETADFLFHNMKTELMGHDTL